MDKDEYLDRVKIGLMKDKNNTFILSIVFSLKKVWDKELSGGMLSVDGKNIYINPEYFVTRSMEGAKADLLHEAYHVVFNHIARATSANLNHRKYNIACDHYINLMLKAVGVEIDDTFICDSKYTDMSVKAIYDDLKDEDIPNDYKPDIRQMDPEDTDKEEQLQVDIKGIISRAVVQAQMSDDYDSVPKFIKRYIEDLLNPVIDWKTQLSNYFSTFAKEDYSFKKPARRFFPEFHLPSLYSESFGSIHIAIDCSGSISQAQYTEFLSEIQGIIDILHPEKTSIRNWGSTLGSFIEVMPDQDILEECNLEMLGGTEIKKPLIEIKKLQPAISVIFTDGQFHDGYKTMDPGCDVLWVLINNSKFTAPYGKIIHLK